MLKIIFDLILVATMASSVYQKEVARFISKVVLPSSPVLYCSDFKISLPLNYFSKCESTDEPSIDVFFRILSKNCNLDGASTNNYLLFLQGGPGFPSTIPTSPLNGISPNFLLEFLTVSVIVHN